MNHISIFPKNAMCLEHMNVVVLMSIERSLDQENFREIYFQPEAFITLEVVGVRRIFASPVFRLGTLEDSGACTVITLVEIN